MPTLTTPHLSQRNWELLGVDESSELVTRDEQGQSWLEIEAVVANPYQPRQTFDEAEIADLCDSIRTHGFLQPIVVRQEGEQFQIIAGERRYRAAQLANWDRIPVQIREVDDRQMAELAIVENVQRKDLNALEKAASFQRYLQEYQCTQEELAHRVSVDRSTVANLIRLLELPEAVKKMLADGDIALRATPGHCFLWATNMSNASLLAESSRNRFRYVQRSKRFTILFIALTPSHCLWLMPMARADRQPSLAPASIRLNWRSNFG